MNGIEVSTRMIIMRKANGESVSAKDFSIENDEGDRLVASQGPHDRSPRIKEHDVWDLKYPLFVGATWSSIEEVH